MMAYITTCTECGALYEEASREAADAPQRQCLACFKAGSPDVDDGPHRSWLDDNEMQGGTA